MYQLIETIQLNGQTYRVVRNHGSEADLKREADERNAISPNTMMKASWSVRKVE